MSEDAGVYLSGKERSMLSSDEDVVYAARVLRVVLGGTRVDTSLAVLTNQRFIASKARLFGTPKADISVPWHLVTRANGQQWPVNPLQIELVFDIDNGSLTVIDDPLTIYEIETRGRSLYSQYR